MTSLIASKSISKDGGRSGYRGLLQVARLPFFAEPLVPQRFGIALFVGGEGSRGGSALETKAVEEGP
jgi:hypothetical protein